MIPPIPAPSLPYPGYPAAHSMDTTWYAVDENGEIGIFKTGSEGVIPVPAEKREWLQDLRPMRQEDFWQAERPGATGLSIFRPFSKEIIDLHEFMAWPPEDFNNAEVTSKYGTHPCLERVFLLFKSRESIPEELNDRLIFETSHGPLVADLFCEYDLFKKLHDEERLLRFWTRSLNPEHDLDEYMELWVQMGIHVLHSVNECNSIEPYIPINTPNLPLTIEDLPEPLRMEAQDRRISNISFRDREAWNPYESFPNCFAYGRRLFYRGSDAFTCFPIPNWRRLWTEQNMFEACFFSERKLFDSDFYPVKYGLGDISRKRFFATDGAGGIAVFNANPFGAYPAALHSIIASNYWEPTAAWDSFLRVHSVSSQSAALPFDLSGLEEMTDEEISGYKKSGIRLTQVPFLALLKEPVQGCPSPEEFVEILQAGPGVFPRFVYNDAGRFSLAGSHPVKEGFDLDKVEKIWRAGWAVHWMEYPFGPITPRRFGFYHYDMCFLHAGPYARIATPTSPANIHGLPEDLVKAMNPVPMPDADFSAMTMIQPMERLDCLSDAPFWIDSTLSRVQPTPGGREPLDEARESRILRRARAHYQMIAELERK